MNISAEELKQTLDWQMRQFSLEAATEKERQALALVEKVCGEKIHLQQCDGECPCYLRGLERRDAQL